MHPEFNFTYPFKTVPYAHQLTALARGWEKREYAYFMEMGCVDKDTEYLSPEGWKSIGTYESGKVAQYNLDGSASFVEPLGYLVKPCREMYHYKSTRGLDQMLSPDHRMLVLRRTKTRKSLNDDVLKPFNDEFDLAETTPARLELNPNSRVYAPTVFNMDSGTGITLSDQELRLQVAFHADGSYGTRDLTGKGVICLKHESKKDRLRMILEEASIPFEVKERGNGFTSFIFIPPLVSKRYDANWWCATQKQKDIILDEVFRWDGTRGRSFFSIHKGDVDFIQFCAVSRGIRASVCEQSDGTWCVRLVGTGRSKDHVCLIHRNVVKVAPPDGNMYCFRVPSSYLVLRRNGCVFVTGNTGKSKVSIDTMAMLYDSGKINAVLIIAPKGVYQNWTDKEIPEHLPDHIPRKVALWRSGLDKKTKEDINSLFQPGEELKFFVINVDALITKKGYPIFEKFLNCHSALILCDESTILKTPSAKRTKAAVKLAQLAAYRRILTGSPVTKSPLDVYSQCEFMNPNLLGHSSYYGFRNRYAICDNKNFGGRSIKVVVGYQNTEELQGILKEFSYRVTKDECLDLPDKIFMKREFEMTDEQKVAYEQMRRMAIAFLAEGEATTTHVITQLLRLHQISCGFLPLDEGGIVEFKSRRLEELMDTLEEVDGKAIIWANYRHDIFMIKEAISKKYGPESIVMYFGDTKDEDRKDAVRNFQDPVHPARYFLGNTQTGGYGITLTEARTVIYYSNNYDLEKRLQSEDRAHRIGQHNPVTYIDLMCKDTVDEKIITALRSKLNIANAVTGDNWKEWI